MAKNIKRIKIPGVTDAYDVIDATAIHSEDVATSAKAGVVKVGSGVAVAADGTISVNADDVGAVSKSGDTMTGPLKVGSAEIQTNGYVTGTWLKTTANISLNKSPTKIAVLDDGWIYSRTLDETKADIGLGNVANERQYSSSNPPPYPVTSVNGQTGAVTIEAGGSAIPVQSDAPAGQKVGDLWFKVI